jgi:hypothetical protein
LFRQIRLFFQGEKRRRTLRKNITAVTLKPLNRKASLRDFAAMALRRKAEMVHRCLRDSITHL